MLPIFHMILHIVVHFFLFFFFFQAEDGIRDLTVTGVQTCALPILPLLILSEKALALLGGAVVVADVRVVVDVAAGGDEPRQEQEQGRRRRAPEALPGDGEPRSEERRVGKECRPRGSRDR